MKIDKKIIKMIFDAGMKCQKMHPDDDTYDSIHLERITKKINKITKSLTPPQSANKNKER